MTTETRKQLKEAETAELIEADATELRKAEEIEVTKTQTEEYFRQLRRDYMDGILTTRQIKAVEERLPGFFSFNASEQEVEEAEAEA